LILQYIVIGYQLTAKVTASGFTLQTGKSQAVPGIASASPRNDQ